MRTTLDLNEDLIKKASRLTKIADLDALIDKALRTLISQSAQKDLAAMDGIQKKVKLTTRR
jgi:hypothetical protein